MTDQFFIKRRDTAPAIMRQFFDGAGAVIPLDGKEVVFSMAELGGSTVIVNRQPCAIVEDAAIYSWKPGDTDRADTFRAEFEITTIADGSVETVPNDGFIYINILEDIA